jgi:2-phospho-L-lactate guanylyltransferase (CobY/MobA/RfbA family)
MIGEVKVAETKEDYFEVMFLYNFYIYMADFPKIKKTSLEDKYSLYNNLFFDIQFDYNNEGILEEIKGAPGWIEYEDKAFVDYLEIASEEGFVYKIKPIFSIDMNLDFEEVISPPECNTLIEESVPDEEVTDEENIAETAETTTT